jgi:hypothetical protein
MSNAEVTSDCYVAFNLEDAFMEFTALRLRLLNDAVIKSYFTVSNNWANVKFNLKLLVQMFFIMVRYCCSQMGPR